MEGAKLYRWYDRTLRDEAKLYWWYDDGIVLSERPRSEPIERWSLSLPRGALFVRTGKPDADHDSMHQVVRWEHILDRQFETWTIAFTERVEPKGSIRAWAKLNGIPCLRHSRRGGFALMPETDAQKLAEKLRWR